VAVILKLLHRLNGLAVVLVACSAVAACAHPQVLTPGEVGRSGSRQFPAPPDKVFYASVGALKAEGYDVESADVERGVIVTKPKLVRPSESSGQNGGLAPAQYVGYQRRYRITVSPGEGGTRVVAEPSLAKGDRDISKDEVWDLDGPNGEKAQWDSLFDDIQSAFKPKP
jgi:hypothetical protein